MIIFFRKSTSLICLIGILLVFILSVAFSVFNKHQISITNIEIFDINKGCVTKKFKSNPAIQKEVQNYLKRITSIYVKFKPIPDKGYMIKIPLKPSVRVKSEWLNDRIHQVIIIFPKQENPYLLVLDDKSRPLFFNFEGNATEYFNTYIS
jgi:hypothetical protein